MIAEKCQDKFAVNELLEGTASEAISRLRDGSIAVECYASQLLKQYRECRRLNTVTWIDENRVLERARSVDMARRGGEAIGPLAGLPVVIKDNINTVGFPASAGTAILKGAYPPSNAPSADALLKNGAILLAKTNMDELGQGVTSSNPTFGFVKNPYDETRVPGGGAGGTAAAISARITPAGLASDTAGSARLPGSFCGVAGLRPSTAGVLRKGWTMASWMVTTWDEGVFPIAYAITTPAPMGRTVSDVALLNAIVTGTTVPAAITLRGIRIGVPNYHWEDVDPEVLRVSRLGLEKLRAAGVTLIDVDLRQWAQIADQTFFTLGFMHSVKDGVDFLATNAPGVNMFDVIASLGTRAIKARIQFGIDNPISMEQAAQARQTRLKLSLQYEDLLRTKNLSAIVYPTVPVLPPKIRAEGDGPNDTVDLNGKQVSEFSTLLRNTRLSGVVGTPSLTLPAGFSSSGLPVGLSFDSAAGSDTGLLGLGLSLEAVLGRIRGPISHARA